MADKNPSQNDAAHTHTRPEKYREVFLGPDSRRLARLYEEYGMEFPSRIPK
ncbi:MAG: hypothetical protein AAGU27_23155 [Dehalobacterium sp.]